MLANKLNYLVLLVYVLGLATSASASEGVKALAETELSIAPSSPIPDAVVGPTAAVEVKAEKPKMLTERLNKEFFLSGQSYTPQGQAQVLGTERYDLNAAGKSTMVSAGLFYWPWKISETLDIGASPSVAFSKNKYPLQTSTGFFFPEIRLNAFLIGLRAAMDWKLSRVFSAGLLAGPGFLAASHSSSTSNTANWSSNLWVITGGTFLKARLFDPIRLAVIYERRSPLGKAGDLDVQADNVQAALLYSF